MSRSRFVVLGVARPRSDWFRAVSAWATSGAVPIEFCKCVSVQELRAHLRSGRRWSAAVLDGGLPAVDRDLLAAVRDAGAIPLVVEAAGVPGDWPSLGAAGVLPPAFGRQQLLDLLETTASVVGTGALLPDEEADTRGEPSTLAPVAVVCGPGGTGASTSAIALAQGIAAAAGPDQPVVLADLCLRADQAMLHDARDVTPGVQELVEAHRSRRPTVEEVHAHTYYVEERGYHLLLGLRRARYWTSVRPHAFEAAFASLREGFGTVVCDVTADFEGEDTTGSIDVEERNVMARTAAAQAAVVLAVGRTGVKGLHGLGRLLSDIADAGVPANRVCPVLVGAPRSPRVRAGVARTLHDLTDGAAHATPVFLPGRGAEEALHDGVAFPSAVVSPLAGAFRATLERAGQPTVGDAEPRPVVPGSMGSWSAGTANG